MPSVIFRFVRKHSWKESSKFYSDLRNASSLKLTQYYCVTMPISLVPDSLLMRIRLSSYTTWSASETAAAVQLPLNSMFLCLAEILSHVILQHQHSCSIPTPKRATSSLLPLLAPEDLEDPFIRIIHLSSHSTEAAAPMPHSLLSTHVIITFELHL